MDLVAMFEVDRRNHASQHDRPLRHPDGFMAKGIQYGVVTGSYCFHDIGLCEEKMRVHAIAANRFA